MRKLKCTTKSFEQATKSARRFSRDEDGGAFTIFVAAGFLLILGTAGIGVDIMNFERDRASLQGALDRAVLAAANTKQTLPAVDVVESYIEKSNVRGELSGVPVVEGDPALGNKKVTAHAEVEVKTHFMQFFGIPKLTASVTSVAEESIEAIEIAMVLDISGSMGWDSATTVVDEDGNEVTLSKMEVLQDAAVEFVNVMYEKENPDKISISIIPYNNQVNAGENILSNMTGVSNEHNYSHCVNFVEDDFDEYWIDPAKSIDRTAHFDVSTNGSNYRNDSHDYSVCPTRAGSAITPVTNVVSDLHDQINAMTADGWTSIDIGVKWGAALLDPQFQPVINQLSEDNVVPEAFDNRPMTYDSNVQKIMIVMTDGENTENWVLDDEYRDGFSDVWYNPNFEHTETTCGRRRCRTDTYYGEYSVRISDDPPQYRLTRHEEHEIAYDDTQPFGGEEEGQSVRLTYPELWNRVNLEWNAEWNYDGQDSNYSNWYTNAFTEIGSTQKDDRLKRICGKVKQNAVIYGIAFEAPDAGVTAIKNCSTGDSYFYKVDADGALDGTEKQDQTLKQVFEEIASSIKRLRLTQ